MFKDLLLKTRSYRRFDENHPVSLETLMELTDLARCTASGANMQPLKYILSCDRIKNEMIFPTLKWAGYLTDWNGPEPGERPAGYIIIVLDKEVAPSAGTDHGIAAQTILLAAAEKEIGGCMLGAVNRKELGKQLKLSNRYEILLVIALGKPAETVILEDVEAGGSIKYYRDQNDVHHVPKRALKNILI